MASFDEKKPMRMLGEHHEINPLPDPRRGGVEHVESTGRLREPDGGAGGTGDPALRTV